MPLRGGLTLIHIAFTRQVAKFTTIKPDPSALGTHVQVAFSILKVLKGFSASRAKRAQVVSCLRRAFTATMRADR